MESRTEGNAMQPGLTPQQPDASQNNAVIATQPAAPIAVPQPTGLPIAAEADSEELDQEWVNKAKEVVEGAKADPFTLSNELSKVRVEYLKTRYNKDVNISEGH